MKRSFFAVLCAVVLGLVPSTAPATGTDSIYDTLAGMKTHTILTVAVMEAKEVTTLKDEGQKYTLLAPTDAAFKKLDDATIQKIVTDKEIAKKIVQAHLTSGKLLGANLKELNDKEVRMLNGSALKTEDAKDGLRIGGVKITTSNIMCSNGVIHVIDTVLPVAKE